MATGNGTVVALTSEPAGRSSNAKGKQANGMGTDRRPLSPHLQIYRPQLTSVLSIAHRASGLVLAAASALLVGWLIAAASGPAAYARFAALAGSIPGRVVLFGITVAFCYHLANGVRHLFWDAGYGFSLPAVYRSGWLVVAFAAVLSLLLWILAYIAAGVR